MRNTVKPEFNISISCLYTYTNNYWKGTLQAKRHHHGREVNANVSLHKAPNTSEQIHPINSHWTTSHVNYLVDSAAENPNGFFLDSKDAKCVVCSLCRRCAQIKRRSRDNERRSRERKTACPDRLPFWLPPRNLHFDNLLTGSVVSNNPANQMIDRKMKLYTWPEKGLRCGR